MTPIVNQTPKCREHFMYVVLLDVFATLDTGMSVKWWAHEGSQGRRIRGDDGGGGSGAPRVPISSMVGQNKLDTFC